MRNVEAPRITAKVGKVLGDGTGHSISRGVPCQLVKVECLFLCDFRTILLIVGSIEASLGDGDPNVAVLTWNFVWNVASFSVILFLELLLVKADA